MSYMYCYMCCPVYMGNSMWKGWANAHSRLNCMLLQSCQLDELVLLVTCAQQHVALVVSYVCAYTCRRHVPCHTSFHLHLSLHDPAQVLHGSQLVPVHQPFSACSLPCLP